MKHFKTKTIVVSLTTKDGNATDDVHPNRDVGGGISRFTTNTGRETVEGLAPIFGLATYHGGFDVTHSLSASHEAPSSFICMQVF